MNPTGAHRDEQQRAGALTSEQAFLYLVRLGGRYERARLAEPRDYPAAIAAERLLNFMQQAHDEVNCGIPFRRGQNFIRRLRGLEEVSAY